MYDSGDDGMDENKVEGEDGGVDDSDFSLVSAVVNCSGGTRLFSPPPLTVRMLPRPASAPDAPRRPPGSGLKLYLELRFSILRKKGFWDR